MLDANVLTMAGTEGTNEYVVLAASMAGRLGIRKIHCGYRIRFEPADTTDLLELMAMYKYLDMATPKHSWKTPNNQQYRFSTVMEFGEERFVKAAIRQVAEILRESYPQFVDADDVPDWAQEFLQSISYFGQGNYAPIRLLQSVAETIDDPAFVDRVCGPKGTNPKLKEMLIEISVLCDRASEEMGARNS